MNGRFDHQLGRGLFSAGWQSDFGRDIERPRSNSRTVRFYYPYENSHRLTASYEVPKVAGLDEWTVTAFAGAFEQRTDQDRFATATTGRTIERADLSAKDFHVRTSGKRQVGIARIEGGLDVNGRFDLEAIDTELRYDTSGALMSQSDNVSIDTARRVDAGVYLQSDIALSPLVRFAAGARGDRVTTTSVGGFFGDRDTANGAFSGFVSSTLGPVRGVSVTGQVSRGFRDPTLSDRYYRGPSGRGFITGNPDLSPERSLQFDAAVRYAFARTQVGFYAYHYRIEDLVERYATAPDFFFFRNRGRARLRGVELEARTVVGRGLAVEGGLAVGRGRALDDRAALDDVTADTVFGVVRQEIGTRGFAQLRASYVARDARPGPSEIATPAARIVDVSGGWRLVQELQLRGIVRNLLDDDYYASPDPRWVYAPGRSASLTLAFQF